MFLLPFVFAGIFMLTALNPRYVTTLISQAIPQTRLLAPVLSPIVGLLANSSLASFGSQHLQSFWHPLSLPSSSHLPETLTIGRSLRGAPGKLGICGSVNASLNNLEYDDACHEGTSQVSPANTEGLELLVLLLLLCLLWSFCSSLVDRLRVPQPLSAVTGVVGDFAGQHSPRAFTPSNSVEFGDLFADEVEEEHPSIPAQLNFVTSADQDASDGSSFIINTGAAIDTIPALPMRVISGPVSSVGGLNELEQLHMDSCMNSQGIETSLEVEDNESALRMAQGITQFLAQARRAPSASTTPNSTHTTRSRANSIFIPAPATSTPALVLPSNSCDIAQEALNTHAAPRGRSRTYCPLSPLLEEARPSASMKPSDKGTSSPTTSSPTQAITEAVQTHNASQAEESWRSRNPSVTVRPRDSWGARRPRMPSSQPLRMATGSAARSTWDQPRRLRTSSGI
ncbi:hypothetical protein BC628DRAFT_742275 [Trametes gibbosa]|nr:hypothetical protein BC628DRAFT_742275 [Trametes gibbosa]